VFVADIMLPVTEDYIAMTTWIKISGKRKSRAIALLCL
jgi:hypothetical protein